MSKGNTNRRDVLAGMAGFGLSGILPSAAFAQDAMPHRRIPGTDESLPIVGLGSSKPVAQIADRGTGPIAGVLRALVANGGRVVDTWPRDPRNDAAFGEVLSEPDLADALFVASKIDRTGKEVGIRQFRDTLLHYRRDSVDLLQVFSLTDLDTQWATLKDFKEAGTARYIGVTVANRRLYEPLTAFLDREQPDFVQINYSISEREAEERMLPMLADRGIGVIINRPFMNGDLFGKLGDQPGAGMGSRVQLPHLGRVLPEVHPAAPGDHLRTDRDQQSRTYDGECTGLLWSHAGRGRAATHGGADRQRLSGENSSWSHVDLRQWRAS